MSNKDSSKKGSAGKPKGKRGGARPLPGPPTKESKLLRAEIVRETEKIICEHLPQLVRNMIHLANGGYERVEEEYDGDGVLVKRKVTIADKDKYANQYLIDRIMGKTSQKIEISTDDDLPKRIVIPREDDRPEPPQES